MVVFFVLGGGGGGGGGFLCVCVAGRHSQKSFVLWFLIVSEAASWLLRVSTKSYGSHDSSRYSVLAVCCSVLQCVAVCCSESCESQISCISRFFREWKPIEDKVAQNLEIISKNFQFSTRRTRILNGVTMSAITLYKPKIPWAGFWYVGKVLETISRFCATVCAIWCMSLINLTRLISQLGWLWLAGSMKSQVFFAEYRLFCRALLQKETYNLVYDSDKSHESDKSSGVALVSRID